MDAETQPEDFYFKAMAWLHAKRKPILIAVIVAAAIGLLSAFLAWRNNANQADATASFFAIPLIAGGQVKSPSPQAFLKVAQDYPGTRGGAEAEVMGAELLFTQGKYEDSQQEFTRFLNDYPDSPLVPQAKIALAACFQAQGKAMQALEKYRDIVLNYPADESLVSPAKLEMARLYEEAKPPQLQQAVTYYSDLARSQDSYNPWVIEARERGMALVARHPELMPKRPAQEQSTFSMDSLSAPETAPGTPNKPAQGAPATHPPKAAPGGTHEETNLLSFPAPPPTNTGKP